MKLKILSWNIWIDGNFRQICDFLKEADADIIGLQEIQADDPRRDVINYLSGLEYDYFFAPVQKVWGGKTWNDGPAVFSRLPIINRQTFLLSTANPRAAVRADIQVQDKILHVFSTHLIHTHQQPSAEQEEQGLNLLKELSAESTILMGDFNATPNSTIIKEIRKILVDSDASSTPTWSVYPEGCKVCAPPNVNFRLDYIFTTKDLKTSGFKVESSKASDHLPISVVIEI